MLAKLLTSRDREAMSVINSTGHLVIVWCWHTVPLLYATQVMSGGLRIRNVTVITVKLFTTVDVL